MIPLSYAVPKNSEPGFDIDVPRLDGLMAGSERGLDTMCNGILNNEPFVYDA